MHWTDPKAVAARDYSRNVMSTHHEQGMLFNAFTAGITWAEQNLSAAARPNPQPTQVTPTVVEVGDVWRARYQDGTAWPFADHVVTKVVTVYNAHEDGKGLCTLARPYLRASQSGSWMLGVEEYQMAAAQLLDPQRGWVRVDTGCLT